MVVMDSSWYCPGTKSSTIHKIWGYSYRISPHIHSARLGVKLFADYMRLVTYIYDGGIRLREKKIIDLPYGSAFASSIDWDMGFYVFRVDDAEVSQSVGHIPGAGIYLYPYFGGQETAPHNITTEIISL